MASPIASSGRLIVTVRPREDGTFVSYRRGKDAVNQSRKWRDFVSQNADVLRSTGIPVSLYESQDMFDDLLMHGYIDHHSDATHFVIGELSASQTEFIVELVVRYLRAGFPDPGIGGFMGGPFRDEVFRRLSQEA